MGKSSITTQLALSLSLAGHSVGILDIDLTGPSIPRFLGIEDAKVRQAPGGWLPVEVHSAQLLQPAPQPAYSLPHIEPGYSVTSGTSETNGTTNGTREHPSPGVSSTGALANEPQRIGPVHAMSLAFLLASRSSAIVWRGPKKTAMVRQFLTDVLWPPTDYLLIDTPPGTSDEHISLVETLLKDISTPAPTNKVNGLSGTGSRRPQLAGAVIVTTPQAVAISDVRKELNFCGKTGVKVIGVVENMSGYVCPCCGVVSNIFSKGGGEVMAREFGVQFLGGVPIDPLWGRLVEEGKRPIYEKVDMDDEGDDEEEMDTTQTDEAKDGRVESRAKREEGLLIDKYRNCSLCPVFRDITAQVVRTVEEGTAVSIGALA